MSEPATSFLDSFKDKLPKSTGALLSAAFFIATLIVNVSSSKTHFADVQAQQDKRIAALEEAVKNDLATRREVDDVKATVVRIEDKLDKEIEYHHR